MKQQAKHIIFIAIVALMLVPALEGFVSIFPEQDLHGDFEELEKPYLSAEKWFEGSYQEEMVPYIEQHIGFHNSLVRLHNQLDYSIFCKPSAEGVIKGKNGQLYEKDYIRAWAGKDFVGEALLDKKLRQFGFLQQYLKDSLQIDLLLVLEPGKASVYPEDIPDRFAEEKANPTNYEFILNRARELDIKLIDFNAYFVQIRDTVDYPLFPKYGTHWSEFAMWYAADSLIGYIEAIRGIDLPEVVIDSIEISDELRSTDYDVGATLNLISELPHEPMPYPHHSFPEPDSSKYKPMVLAVADSYYWNMYNTRIPKNLFSNEAFWYFYKMVYPDTWYNETFVTGIDLREEVEKQEVIMLMMTERFLYKFDRGFVDDLFAIYGKTSLYDSITHYKTSIVNLDSWFSDIIRKARRRNITVGEMMEIDARYMLRLDDPEAFFSLYGPAAITQEIRDNEKWYESVRKNALRKNISINEQILEEAAYVINQQHPEALERYYRLSAAKDSIKTDSALSVHLQAAMKYYRMTEEEMLQVMAEEIAEAVE
ncbi:MAG: hypothetical protein RQ761_10795 [Bacteroidales bacterium]|nr:hypothetical protein [Bacteroidales bacterium]